MIEVTAAVIVRDGRVLICQRPEGKNCAMLWEFPGGKQERGETLEDCIRRECLEELGLHLRVERKLGEVVQPYPDRTVHLHFFLCRAEEKVPQRLEHRAVAWVLPGELNHYTFCPADERMLDQWREQAVDLF